MIRSPLRSQGNEISQVPAAIGNLADKLLSLNIKSNKIAALPVEIGSLSLLKQLDASRNQLVDLPAAFGHCTALQELHLSGTLPGCEAVHCPATRAGSVWRVGVGGRANAPLPQSCCNPPGRGVGFGPK